MPFCTQCGADNPASARFCDQCGSELIAVPGPTAAPTMQATPAAPQPPIAQTAAAGQASAGPSVCPQCAMAVIPGEAFCDNCGAALLGSTPAAAPAAAPTLPYGGVPPQPSYPAPQPAPAQAPQSTGAASGSPLPATSPIVAPPAVATRTVLAPATLLVQHSGASIALPSAAEALLGRADAVSNFFPDLDMTPHGALDRGVGRRHARLFVRGGQLLVEDLDSTNGTFLNTTRLAPRQPTPLKAGDELRFGNLVLTVQL